MVNVLYIGMYKETGKFNTVQWKCFIDWCKKECNRVIVYSHMPYNIILPKFPLYCKINELVKPDKDLDVYAYEMNVIHTIFWDYIKDFNYNIDQADDISHMFFYRNKKYIASLEIVDYENYIIIEEPMNQKDKFFLNVEMAMENNRFCLERKSDINALLQEESWKPLGDERSKIGLGL